MARLIRPDGVVYRIRWTDQVPGSCYGLGVVFVDNTSQPLSPAQFRDQAEKGAYIVCRDERERKRICGALAWGSYGVHKKAFKLERTVTPNSDGVS